MLMKRFSTFVLTVLTALCGTSAWAQTSDDYTIIADLTSSKLQNADFQSGSPVDVLVRTYAYDMTEGNGVGDGGSERYGQQAVTGWTAETPSDNKWVAKATIDANVEAYTGPGVGMNARAGAVFQFNESTGLGGAYYAPDLETDGEQFLGYVAVWSGDIKYYQNVTLPAGAYIVEVTYYNVAGESAVAKNYMGFVTDSGDEYLGTTTAFPKTIDPVSLMPYSSRETIIFELDEETSGRIQLGYRAAGLGSGSMPHIFVSNVKIYQIDPNDLIRDEINALKVDLLALIEEGKIYGADTSASQAVYDNDRASLEDVQNAIENQKRLNKEATTDISASFIRNPHFTEDAATAAGICTYAKDCATNGVPADNHGMMPITGWTASQGRTVDGPASGIYEVGSSAFLGGKDFLPPTTMSDGSTTGKLLGICGSWSTLVAYTQYVSIPKGKYILSVSYYNSGGANAVAKNLIGFIADDGTEYLCQTTTFPVGRWGKETITFELDEQTSGRFSMGYQAANDYSSTQPHFFIDGISLIYIGTDINASLEALKAAVSNANATMASNWFYTDLTTQLQGLVDDGQKLIDRNSTDDEANQAAADAINNLMPLVNANIQAYKDLDTFLNEPGGALYEAANTYFSYEIYPNTAGMVEIAAENADNALKNRSWSTEQINTAITSLQENLVTELQKDFDNLVASGTVLPEPMNISPLFSTLGVTYSTATAGGDGNASNVPDKQWNFGNATNFKTQYGTMEVWNQSPFEVSQTLTDLPNGTYTVATRGFYRTADNATNLANYDPDDKRAFVFAGFAKTPLINVVGMAEGEEKSGWTAAGEGVYVANNQQAAYTVFEDEEYDSFTLKSAKSVVNGEGGKGELTFGVKGDAMDGNCWTVWYTFELYFNNSSDADMKNELQPLMDEIIRLEELCEPIGDVYNNLCDAWDNGDEARTSTDPEVISRAYNLLKSQIAAANNALAVLNDLRALGEDYNIFYSKFPYSSSDQSVASMIDDALYRDDFDRLSDIKKLISDLPVAWNKYVLGQKLSEASETKPVDITGIIRNNDFELLNTRYWTIAPSDPETGIGPNVGFQNNGPYKNADGEDIIQNFMEAWRDNTNGYLYNGRLYQDLEVSLPEGYYLLEADAFAINQGGVPAEETLTGINLYMTGSVWSETPITLADNNSSVAQHLSLVYHQTGSSYATVGVDIFDTNANWIVIDNFKLSYIGTTPPVGIDDITAATGKTAIKHIYSLTGTRLNTLQKGINIIVDADGNARKVLVK